jgi:hypothetical protein
VAAALSKDPNMGKVYKLEKEYIEGIRPKPKHPETNEEYDDPRVCLHIMAATSLDPEVKRLVEEEPWDAQPGNPVVKPVRKKAKPLSYGLIYLAKAPTIAGQINTSVDEAQVAIDKYFSYPDGFYGLHEWLESTAMIGTELRWIRLITGEIVMTSESNSKGLSDSNSTARKSCNSSIQGVSSTQSKLALIKAHKKFKELDKKYEAVLNGRKAELIAIVHR